MASLITGHDIRCSLSNWLDLHVLNHSLVGAVVIFVLGDHGRNVQRGSGLYRLAVLIEFGQAGEPHEVVPFIVPEAVAVSRTSIVLEPLPIHVGHREMNLHAGSSHVSPVPAFLRLRRPAARVLALRRIG